MEKKGRRVASSMCTDPSREEMIKDVKCSIKANVYLIHYYQDLIRDEPENHLSFQAYLREIDKRGDAIKEERRCLLSEYAKASKGEIPSLQKQNEELEIKLKTLRAGLTPAQQAVRREKKITKIKLKTKNLQEKIAALEQELRDADFDFDSDTEFEEC